MSTQNYKYISNQMKLVNFVCVHIFTITIYTVILPD